MIIRGLGAVGVFHHGDLTRLQPAQKRILAILMAAGPDGLSSARFAEEVWQDDLPRDWEGAVRQSISRMRRAVGLSTIVNSTRHYALDRETAVDVWRLRQMADGDGGQRDSEQWSLIAGEPYPGVEHSPLLLASIEQLTADRVELLKRSRNTSDTPSAALLDASRSFLVHQPFREDVLDVVVRLHIAAGLDSNASQLLENGIEVLETVGPVSDGLAALRDRLRHQCGERQAAGNGVVVFRPARASLVGNIDVLETAQAIDRPALARRVRAAVEHRGAIITGESGSGKTSLARSIAATAFADGMHVVWLSGHRDLRAAYGPFVAALPWLRTDLDPLLKDGGDIYQRSACWHACAESLSRRFPDRRLTIFIDDAQWLDSHSQMLIEFLALSSAAFDTRLVVTGRHASDHDGWRSLAASLTAAGLRSIESGEFGNDELIALVGRLHPRATSKQRADVAAALKAARATLPVIANAVLQAANPATLSAAKFVLTSPDSVAWTDGLTEVTKTVGAAAAVMGISFRLDSVASLTGLSTAVILGAFDEMVEAKLLIGGRRPDEFNFRHLVIYERFAELLDRNLFRSMHLAAATAAGPNDPHGKARHLLAAGPLVEVEDLYASLLRSARAHRHVGSFREATESYAIAIDLGVGKTDGHVLCEYADAMDLSGADGWRNRQIAFNLAKSAGDHRLSLEVAIGGAHRTEDVEGDARRAELLDRVDLDHLDAAMVQRRNIALARELSLLGEHDRASALSRNVIESAEDPDTKAAAWMASWPTYLIHPSPDWPALPVNPESVHDLQLQARLLHVECMRALVVGDDARARELLVQCENPVLQADPMRAWFVSLLRSMMAFTDGEWSLSNEIADQGLAAAQRAGISSAFSARAAQGFGQHWLCGRHGDLLPLLEGAAPDVQQSMLARAAHAVSLAADGTRAEEAKTALFAMTHEVAASRSHAAPATAALLASAAPPAWSDGFAALLRPILAPFAGTTLVVGTGVTSVGPATRALSMLASSRNEQMDLLSTAIEEADCWNLRLWSVRCRLDLYQLNHENRVYSEARELAVGTDLASELFDD